MITQISYVIISGCDHTDLLCNFPCLCVLYKKMFYQYVSVIFLASHFFMYIFILSTGLKKKFFLYDQVLDDNFEPERGLLRPCEHHLKSTPVD